MTLSLCITSLKNGLQVAFTQLACSYTVTNILNRYNDHTDAVAQRALKIGNYILQAAIIPSNYPATTTPCLFAGYAMGLAPRCRSNPICYFLFSIKAFAFGYLPNYVAQKKSEDSIKQRQEREAAIEIAKANIRNPDEKIRGIALSLFTQLIERGFGIDVAIETAKTNFMQENWHIAQTARHLFIQIIDQGKGLDALIEIAKTYSDHEYADPRRLAVFLFDELMKRDLGVKTAIETAKTNIRNENWEISYDASLIFQALIRRGHGVEAASEAAEILLQRSSAPFKTLGSMMKETIDLYQPSRRRTVF